MTEYHTAERTATTPLHVSTTPHLAYLLVLLALLAADIATTVWFTGLGLPELNPMFESMKIIIPLAIFGGVAIGFMKGWI